MSLQDFLHFNKECPICREPLDLYMQWHHSTLWKGYQSAPGTYDFTPFKLKKDDLKDSDMITIKEEGLDTTTYFSSLHLDKLFNKQAIHLFFLCNDAGFVDKGEPAYDYEISLYRGCYFRSSIEYKMQKVSKKRFELAPSQEGQEKFINQEESFSFKDKSEELEKVYMLSLKSVDNVTKLWHYAATPEQKKDENFEPKLFDKELPYLSVRPKFDLENRENLISRFNSWIIMS